MKVLSLLGLRSDVTQYILSYIQKQDISQNYKYSLQKQKGDNMASIQNNPQPPQPSDNYQTLKNSGLSQRQLDALDAMDGSKDEQIADDVFTIASSVVNHTEYHPETQEASAKAFQIQFILQTKDNAYNEWGETNSFRTMMSNEAVMEDLGITEEQTQALANLRPGEGMTGIDPSVYFIAKTIQMGQPYYDKGGQNQELHDQVQQILGTTSNYTTQRSEMGL